MRSTLETIDGRYEHAVFTTYSLNLHFLELWVLPLLRRAEVRNIIVFADEAQLGMALEDKGLRQIGRSYHVVSTRLGPGAFHPKLILLSGDKATRLCVSSANLTVDGQLRNLEAGIVLDTSVEEHLPALADAGAFLRRLGEHAPAATAEALLAAVAPIPASDAESGVRFVHNLDRPLIESFPRGAFTAVTPFADDGKAALALTSRGRLTVVTDGDRFAAGKRFFAGDWTVEPRSFEHRRLHAKAYWSDTPPGGWLLVGSPNLSQAALLQTAADANTEVAIILAPHTPRLPEVPGEPWTLGSLEELATRRHAAERGAGEQLPGAFNAWEDEDGIVVSGIADGAAIDHWDGTSWQPLGLVLNSRIDVGAEERPYLIRARLDGTAWRQAIVHRPGSLLRQRLRARTTSRAADVVSTLPLDLEGVKTLEAVITDLYVLAELKDESERLPRLPTERATTPEEESLTGWRPARPEDEPRVPDIYRQSWKGEPDALLALIRSALRLDRHDRATEQEVSEELLELGDLEGEPEPAPEPPTERPQVQKPVLTRYRNALVKLLARGADFVRRAQSPVLADLGFQTVLRLHEQLTGLEVDVDDETQPLIEPDVLRRQKLDLLCAYLLDRTGRDAHCLATARLHLADCLNAHEFWQPLEWEQLEALAYKIAPMILTSSAFLSDAAEDAGIDAAQATARLRPYAERADWSGFFIQAETELESLEFDEKPFPWARGEDWFDELIASPAWRLVGYGAIAAFPASTIYGVIVENANRHSAHAAHLLLVDPAAHTLYEGMQRRVDAAWLVLDLQAGRPGDDRPDVQDQRRSAARDEPVNIRPPARNNRVAGRARADHDHLRARGRPGVMLEASCSTSRSCDRLFAAATIQRALERMRILST